jgi:hypothetical protein
MDRLQKSNNLKDLYFFLYLNKINKPPSLSHVDMCLSVSQAEILIRIISEVDRGSGTNKGPGSYTSDPPLDFLKRDTNVKGKRKYQRFYNLRFSQRWT